MLQRIHICLVGFFCGLLLLSARASGQFLVASAADFTVSTGYSNLQTQRADHLFYEHSGPYLDTDVAWTLPLVVPLQVGCGLNASGYWQREPFAGPANSDFYDPYNHLYSDVGLFEIEPRVGVYLGRRTGFFALPRLGAGLLIDSYSIDQSLTSNGNTYLSTQYHTGAAIEVRPAIQVGYNWGGISAGLEGSYMYSYGDFGGLGHHAQEFGFGAFLKFSF